MSNIARICSVEECENVAIKRKLCNAHYLRWKKYDRVTVPCSIDGCSQNAMVKGLCEKHYIKWHRNVRKQQSCTIDGCERNVAARGWCQKHHLRYIRYGDPLKLATVPHEPHGLVNTPEYRIWVGIKSRCTKEESGYPFYDSYKGKGITVCDRWMHSFRAFYGDMGSRPTPQHSIERKDNDKGYSPDNCRWATKSEQSINTRLIQSSNTSGYRGVSRHDNQWLAKISIETKVFYLGLFKTPDEAAYVRDQFAIELHGQYAQLNVL